MCKAVHAAKTAPTRWQRRDAANRTLLPSRLSLPLPPHPAQAQQQYTAAIQTYRNTLRKFPDFRSSVVMLYLARQGRPTGWPLRGAALRPAAVICARQHARTLSCLPLAVCQFAGHRLLSCLTTHRTVMCYAACPVVGECRAQYDADQLPEAKRTLSKALHLAPTSCDLRFDIGVTLQASWVVSLVKRAPAP